MGGLDAGTATETLNMKHKDITHAEAGKYVVTYHVKDKAGNKECKSPLRTVVVKDTLPPSSSSSLARPSSTVATTPRPASTASNSPSSAGASWPRPPPSTAGWSLPSPPPSPASPSSACPPPSRSPPLSPSKH